jgi:hypothetical protein
MNMIPGIESNLQDLNFTWVCVDFQPTYMDFLVNYTHYSNVSVHEFKDQLQVKFNGIQYFRAKSTKETIEQTISTLQKVVPLQMDPNAGGLAAAAAVA